MKGIKIFSPLAAAVILSQLLITILATPVLAASVTVSPPSGPVDKTVTVSGTGFTANNPYTITFAYDTPFSVRVGHGIVGDNGEIPPTSFSVPGIPGGAYTIRVESFGETGEHVSRTFLIIPDIDLDQSYGPVGNRITVDGTGFAAGKNVIIYFEDEALASALTDETGRFTDAPFAVPESFRGSHTVRALDEVTNYATDSFSTRESLTITTTSGTPGDEVTVNGTGFRANRPITITLGGEVVSSTSPKPRSNDKGSFSDAFTVPLRPSGTYEVEASDGTYRAKVNFTVVSGVSLTPTTGTADTKLTVTGTGFSGQVTVKYDDEVVATTTAESSGDFSASFDAPPSIPGTHTITASDGINTKVVTFTMEPKAPPPPPPPPLSVPVPLSPPTDTEVEPTPHFDWEDVKDADLPVTYTLQIASDQDFASIVLERKELTESEYTVTEEEKLKPGGKSAPYYWRVKAVDSAANESTWSTPQPFYVGATFSLAKWGLYALIGLGALLLGLLGFVLGRRTSYG